MPAATAEVAHATAGRCHGTCRRRQSGPIPGRIWPAFRPLVWRTSRVTSHPGIRFRCETADAARVAATRSGGWRTSRTVSCSSRAVLC